LVLRRDQAELLLLRSHDLSYDELAATLDLRPTSVGTLLRRARQAFRKEYVKRYGNA
jgi:RNA polymerase sigma-70 factor (ECF subfamily)